MRLAGVVAVTQEAGMHPDACGFHLWGLYVTLEDRGGPAAQALISPALTWCRQQPHQQAVGLHVPRSTARAQPWFARLRFRPAQDDTLRRPQLLAMRPHQSLPADSAAPSHPSLSSTTHRPYRPHAPLTTPAAPHTTHPTP